MLVLGKNWKTRSTLDSKLLGQITQQSGNEPAIFDYHVSLATLIAHPTADSTVTKQ